MKVYVPTSVSVLLTASFVSFIVCYKLKNKIPKQTPSENGRMISNALFPMIQNTIKITQLTVMQNTHMDFT